MTGADVVLFSLSPADLTRSLRPLISLQSMAATAFAISSLDTVSANANLRAESC